MDLNEISCIDTGSWYTNYMLNKIATIVFRVSVGLLLIGVGLVTFHVTVYPVIMGALPILAGLAFLIKK